MSGESVLGQFREANEHLGNIQKLNEWFEEDGYLFFRGVLDGVDKVKQDFVRVLQKQGAVQNGQSEPVWTGANVDQIDDNGLYSVSSCDELFRSQHNLKVFEQIFGEPVFVFRSPTIRFALPNDSERVSPPHQDYFFVRINKSFRTFWVPLMDIDQTVGGLAIAPGSHHRGMFDHVEAENVYSYVFKGRKQRGIPMQSVPRPWATTDYRGGDLLVFHNLMIHWALPNLSDRVRLSIDNRCAPINAPRSWQAEKSILEAREFRKAAQKIANEEGASEELFEAVIIELMGRDLKPERPQIKSLMAELSAKN